MKETRKEFDAAIVDEVLQKERDRQAQATREAAAAFAKTREKLAKARAARKTGVQQ